MKAPARAPTAQREHALTLLNLPPSGFGFALRFHGEQDNRIGMVVLNLEDQVFGGGRIQGYLRRHQLDSPQ